MSYCDFNPRLFKPFTSMKTKIIPSMANDWEIIPSTYNTKAGFSLYSKKINQQVADINLLRFLRFSKEQNLTISSLKLTGNFIIGNDRSVYTVDMYNQWKEKFDIRTEIILNKKDYIVGNRYKTPCGAEFVYLGFRYTSKMKSYEQIGKIKKIFYVHTTSSYRSIQKLDKKFSVDLGPEYSEDECLKHLTEYYNLNLNITYFEKFNNKDPKYILIPLKITRPNHIMCLGFKYNEQIHVVHSGQYGWSCYLKVKDNELQYTETGMYMRTRFHIVDRNLNMLVKHKEFYHGEKIKVDETFRVGVIV